MPADMDGADAPSPLVSARVEEAGSAHVQPLQYLEFQRGIRLRRELSEKSDKRAIRTPRRRVLDHHRNTKHHPRTQIADPDQSVIRSGVGCINVQTGDPGAPEDLSQDSRIGLDAAKRVP